MICLAAWTRFTTVESSLVDRVQKGIYLTTEVPRLVASFSTFDANNSVNISELRAISGAKGVAVGIRLYGRT